MNLRVDSWRWPIVANGFAFSGRCAGFVLEAVNRALAPMSCFSDAILGNLQQLRGNGACILTPKIRIDSFQDLINREDELVNLSAKIKHIEAFCRLKQKYPSLQLDPEYRLSFSELNLLEEFAHFCDKLQPRSSPKEDAALSRKSALFDSLHLTLKSDFSINVLDQCLKGLQPGDLLFFHRSQLESPTWLTWTIDIVLKRFDGPFCHAGLVALDQQRTLCLSYVAEKKDSFHKTEALKPYWRGAWTAYRFNLSPLFPKDKLSEERIKALQDLFLKTIEEAVSAEKISSNISSAKAIAHVVQIGEKAVKTDLLLQNKETHLLPLFDQDALVYRFNLKSLLGHFQKKGIIQPLSPDPLLSEILLIPSAKKW